MLDINIIRENPHLIQKSCQDKGYNINIHKFLELDKEWRSIKSDLDELRHKKNILSEEINQLIKAKKDIKILIKEVKEIPEKIIKLEKREKDLKEELDIILKSLPNIPDKSVPIGLDISHNKIIKTWGKLKKFSFKPKTHYELGESLGIIDTEKAAKLAGSGFYILKGKGAQLQRALVNFMIDYHLKNGFIEINPPQIVNSKTMFGTGQLPKFENDLYKTNDDLYLIPTAEVPLTNLHQNEVLNPKDLPKYYVGFTQCYRTEAGKHGTETRGIFRLHEFEKVEMVKIVKQDNSYEELESMRRSAEKILELLNIPYRVLLLCSGDMSLASAKTYDLEVYSSATKTYLETSSCSNCTDFQARRMNTKYQEKGEIKYVHTLNGSGLALPRLMIALLEQYQQKDGSIKIPIILQKYTGFKKIDAIK